MGKKDDLFNFGTEDLSAISAGFDKQIDALGATDRELAKARVFCIRGKFSDALKIYESVVDEEVENVGGYIGIVRVHSKNFTVFDGAEIEKDIDIVRQIARGQNVKDEEYAEYLDARKKYFDKIAEDKKKKAEAEKLAKQKAAEEMQRKAAADAEIKRKNAEEERKRLAAKKEAEERAYKAEMALRRKREAERAAEEEKRRLEKERKLAEQQAQANALKTKNEQVLADTSVPKVDGKTVIFGAYYQSSDTYLEPLKWQILDEKVISKTKTEKEVDLFICTEKIIDAIPFIDDYSTPGKFYGSSIKKWLENEFMDTAFNDTAKKYIVNGYVENDEKTMYKSCPRYKKDYFGFNCPIYLLSYSELKKYFKNDRARIKEPTEYAKQQGLERNVYWTRSSCDFYTGNHGFEGAKSSSSNISVCTESGDITKFAGSTDSNVISFEFENKIQTQVKTKFGVVCAMKIKVTLPR